MQSVVLGPIGPTLGAFVARNRCKRLRLATDGLPEKFAPYSYSGAPGVRKNSSEAVPPLFWQLLYEAITSL